MSTKFDNENRYSDSGMSYYVSHLQLLSTVLTYPTIIISVWIASTSSSPLIVGVLCAFYILLNILLSQREIAAPLSVGLIEKRIIFGSSILFALGYFSGPDSNAWVLAFAPVMAGPFTPSALMGLILIVTAATGVILGSLIAGTAPMLLVTPLLSLMTAGFISWVLVDQVILTSRELEKRMTALEKALKVKTDFMTMIGHEIKTPLNGMIGTMRLLSETSTATDKKALIELFDESENSMMMILDSILNLTSIESGGIEAKLDPCELRRLLIEINNLMQAKIQDIGLQLKVAVPKEELWIQSDAFLLKNILVNLVDNAIKFTPQGSIELSFSFVKKEDSIISIKIYVKDSGIGIHRDSIDSLFKLFYQVESGSNRRYQGVGLGLTVCREYAKLLGGEVYVQSKIGKGSTFWIEFDAEVSPGIIPKLQSQRSGPVQKGNVRVLLVEDNVINRKIAMKFLERIDCDITIAVDGQEAIEEFSKSSFDLVLMDCLMPRIDGYEATKAIRKLEERSQKHTPIIALTANTQKGDREKCIDAGMDDYMSKPINLNKLTLTFDRWIIQNDD